MKYSGDTPKKIFLTAFGAVFLWLTGLSQSVPQCATPQVNPSDPQAIAQFESWLSAAQKERIAARQNEEVVTIPIVIHVVHRGELLGQGANISMAQILSQVEVLNEDFRMQNDNRSETYPQFASVAADIEVEFVLAKQDPEGLPTDGVNRVEGPQSGYTFSENLLLKEQSYWPAEDYLNVWVAPLQGGLLGWAQFPESPLAGLDGGSQNRFTDGVVVDYEYFGRTGNINQNSLGRTATHEVGHFFGLRHIWGDGDCNADDFVDDTPLQERASNQCGTLSSCGSLDMVQNYMDYSPDACMTLFTELQKARMRTVLMNSPRRNSLPNSLGGQAPVQVNNDLGVRQVLAPEVFLCAPDIAPSIEVRNYGTNLITEYTVELQVDGNPQDTVAMAGSLTSLSVDTVNFAPFTFARTGSHELLFRVLSVNGGADGKPINDSLSYGVVWSDQRLLPSRESFAMGSSGWSDFNPDGTLGWQHQVLTIDGEPDTALVINFFNYALGVGERDWLLSPVVDLSDQVTTTLSFSYAYAAFAGVLNEGLEVWVSTDCGNTFPHRVYSGKGESLSTVNVLNQPFVPTSHLDFRSLELDLNAFAGQPSVQVAFVAINGWGNNLYLDDILWEAESLSEYDVALTELDVPYGFGGGTIAPRVRVVNDGQVPTDPMELEMAWDGAAPTTVSVNRTLVPGESIWVELPEKALVTTGPHELAVRLAQPDDNSQQNQLVRSTWVSPAESFIPLRAQADDVENWPRYTRRPNGLAWEVWEIIGADITTQVLQYPAYQDTVVGNEAVLLSPTLNLTANSEASVRFEVSYLVPRFRRDSLSLWVSTDGGESWPHRVWVGTGRGLGNSGSNVEWRPSANSSWQSVSVPLSEYAGEPELRVAWVATNDYGQNVYVRAIEFFESNSGVSLEMFGDPLAVWPNPSLDGIGQVTLELETPQPATLSVMDSRGKVLGELKIERALNQTYSLPIEQLAPGLYFVVLETPFTRESVAWVVGK